MATPKNATVDEAKQGNQTPQQNKPIIDQMADLAAGAAGALVETAVKAAASRATAAVAKRAPASLKKAAKTVGRAGNTSGKAGAKATVKARPAKKAA
jgi:hypothetical protein